jgi:two-component sensor histidine kinase
MTETTHDHSKARGALQDFQGRSTPIDDLREQLLDELNHRLKNNLQILNGLLLIALHKTDNSEAREVLFDTSRRIGAMGKSFIRSTIQPMSAGRD